MKEVDNEIDLVKTVFGNPNGEKLLAIWRKVYIERPSYVPGQPIEDCAFYEGQRSQILAIIQMKDMKL